MLTISNELGKWCDESTGTFNLDAFKIVYVAPMEALVQEMVGNFNSVAPGPVWHKGWRAYWRFVQRRQSFFPLLAGTSF